MSGITIPPEALEAGVKAFAEAEENMYTTHAEDLRAAFLAMIEAWEGAAVCHYTIGDVEGYEMVLPLPFPQEKLDAEA